MTLTQNFSPRDRTDLRAAIAAKIGLGDAINKFSDPNNPRYKMWAEWNGRMDSQGGGLMGLVGVDARALYASGAFGKKYDDMTAADETRINHIWANLPGMSRSGDQVTFEQKADDVAKFLRDMKVLSIPQLQEARGLIEGLAGKYADQLTRGQVEMVNSVWEQLGGLKEAKGVTFIDDRLFLLPQLFTQNNIKAQSGQDLDPLTGHPRT